MKRSIKVNTANAAQVLSGESITLFVSTNFDFSKAFKNFKGFTSDKTFSANGNSFCIGGIKKGSFGMADGYFMNIGGIIPGESKNFKNRNFSDVLADFLSGDVYYSVDFCFFLEEAYEGDNDAYWDAIIKEFTDYLN